jgi:hypothetical protein
MLEDHHRAIGGLIHLVGMQMKAANINELAWRLKATHIALAGNSLVGESHPSKDPVGIPRADDRGGRCDVTPIGRTFERLRKAAAD